MGEEQPLVVHREGAGWSFTYDLSPLPDYVLLTLRGRGTIERGQQLIEVIRECQPLTEQEDGRYAPGITDLREEGAITMDGIKLGKAIVEELGNQTSYAVLLLDRRHPNMALIQLFLTIIGRLLPNRLATASTMQEAIDKVRAYHGRQGRG